MSSTFRGVLNNFVPTVHADNVELPNHCERLLGRNMKGVCRCNEKKTEGAFPTFYVVSATHAGMDNTTGLRIYNTNIPWGPSRSSTAVSESIATRDCL